VAGISLKFNQQENNKREKELKEESNCPAKLRLKPTNNDSVFFDFRVYRAFVNTEIKEHGDHLKIRSVCKEFSLSNGSALQETTAN